MRNLILAAAGFLCFSQLGACADGDTGSQAVAVSAPVEAADSAIGDIGAGADENAAVSGEADLAVDTPALAQVPAVVTPRTARKAQLPERIVMMYQVTGKNYAKDFAELKSLGVNVAQSFSLSQMDPEYVDGYLAAAESAGIGVVINVAKFVEGKDANCALSSEGESFIQAHAAAPALLAWHTVDEAATHGITKQCQVRIYRQVKKLDPQHLVMASVNFTQQKDYDGYFDERAFDFLDLHRYVGTDVGPSQQRLIDVFRKNRKRDYRVIVTLRAFNAVADKVRRNDQREMKRQDMRGGALDAQYDYFFRKNKLGDDIGFYGWRLSNNLGISQLDWMKKDFERLAREDLGGGLPKTQ